MRSREWRRRIGGDGVPQTFDDRIDASTNDGWSRAGGSPAFSDTGADLFGGVSASQTYDSWARFDPVTIPAGATIDAAEIRVTASLSGQDGADLFTNIYLEGADDPAVPSSQADHVGRARTTNFTAWDGKDFTVDLETASPDIALAVQEVVDRPGWNSGQAMQVFWDDDGSIDAAFYEVYAWNQDTAKAIALHVEYTA